MTIFLDIDQVLTNWIYGFSYYLKCRHGIDFIPEKNTYYEYISDNFKLYFDEFYQSPDVYGTYVNLFPDAEDFVNELKKTHKVKFITNTYPSEECIKNKSQYLSWMLSIPVEDIIHASRKYLYMTKEDILVDDKPWNCYQHSSINKGRSILFNYHSCYLYCNSQKLWEFALGDRLIYATSYKVLLRFLGDE